MGSGTKLFMVLYLSICAWHLNNLVSRCTFENVSCYVSYLHIPKCALCFSSMITFAQYLQRCSYDGLSKLVKDVVDLAQKCVANEDAPECTKSLVCNESFGFVFLLILCSYQHYPQWGFIPDPFRCGCCHWQFSDFSAETKNLVLLGSETVFQKCLNDLWSHILEPRHHTQAH